jgi:signal transduction histidine kinase
MYASRLQILLAILGAFFLLGTIAILIVFAIAPGAALVYRPMLLTGFVVMLFVSMVCVAGLIRGLLRPYNQLIGEAQRAPVPHSGKRQNEAAFVLETFQSVIAQLQEQQQELKRLSDQASQRADSAEAFSDHIVASMPTGLLAFDAAGRLTLMNGPARDLFPTEENVRGEHFTKVLADSPAFIELLQRCLATGSIYRREEIETKNGLAPAKRLGATIAPIDATSESGARGALCLVTDITEVSRLREQVALKKNLESLGEMSAGLAHEFKNAMAALHGYAQFLQTVDQDEQGRSVTEALLQEVRSLSEMTTAFLNFARPQTLQLEDVSIGEVLDECVRELGPSFESRDIQCVRSPTMREGNEAMIVRADTRMLRQTLLNLLRNAAEAIPDEQNDRRVIIETSVEAAGAKRTAVISISDTGHGIAPSDLQKIFIPFFTTKSHGHGIGLALAHRVITEHGGTLMATSSPPGGAVFTVRLPLWSPDSK